MKCLLALPLILMLLSGQAGAEVQRDVPYVERGDAYRMERTRLDLYLPEGKEPTPALVWFHGGGLTGGDKAAGEKLGEKLRREGVVMVVPNYRLSPQAQYPSYVEDAAAAVAWVYEHAKELKIDPARVYVGGHSAGGYLASMLAMDGRYLAKAGVAEGKVAGFIPVSGQMMTHFTVRKERGVPESAITADEAAPIHYMRKNLPPMLVLMGDRDWPARLEENAYFVAASRAEDSDAVSMVVIADRDHGSIVERMPEKEDPAEALLRAFVVTGKRPPTQTEADGS